MDENEIIHIDNGDTTKTNNETTTTMNTNKAPLALRIPPGPPEIIQDVCNTKKLPVSHELIKGVGGPEGCTIQPVQHIQPVQSIQPVQPSPMVSSGEEQVTNLVSTAPMRCSNPEPSTSGTGLVKTSNNNVNIGPLLPPSVFCAANSQYAAANSVPSQSVLQATNFAPTDQIPLLSTQPIDQTFSQIQSIPLPIQDPTPSQFQIQQPPQPIWQLQPSFGYMPPPCSTLSFLPPNVNSTWDPSLGSST